MKAERAAELILAAHRGYLEEFNALTAKAQERFDTRAWAQGSLDAERRVRLYRAAVNEAWLKMQRRFPEQTPLTEFWMAARHFFLVHIFEDYDADLALTFFYSTMRIAFDQTDFPVEYADDGLAERPHVWNPEPVSRRYRTNPGQLSRCIEEVLKSYGFRAAFESLGRDAALAAERMLAEWRQTGAGVPRHLYMLKPALFRDREAYLVGKLSSNRCELPVVFALTHGESGITVDAVLIGKEDMRNILFISTRSTFHVRADSYREVLNFLDTLAPERGHPAMCAVIGFTHPARVALNQRLRQHLRETGERFVRAPGRVGTAMAVFSPPSFPYVFKVIRDFSSKPGWKGGRHISEVYRLVHEMNRGRLMLDAWIYRNLHFPRAVFDEPVLEELLRTAPESVRMHGDTVVLKQVYAQRKVEPLSTFFDETRDRILRERAADALGTFVEDMAGMGLFISDCYGLPFNLGLTHGFNVALFDFDDLGMLLRCRFRETPPQREEGEELLWNTESDGAWFSIGEDDVLVDEWERYLGVPPDLQEYFRQKHGNLFTVDYWVEEQQRMKAGGLHFVLPYPQERRLKQKGQAP
ncbi:MAG TPA: isocitrate dehydrogenase kinase/phosphatase AceK regulatory subunit [Bryobacteraceae bacterium]|nr:isocitrate dehydrogenase kinase/phosphatase AceK regulatory subunit [Bryobacteraceae bacterium]